MYRVGFKMPEDSAGIGLQLTIAQHLRNSLG